MDGNYLRLLEHINDGWINRYLILRQTCCLIDVRRETCSLNTVRNLLALKFNGIVLAAVTSDAGLLAAPPVNALFPDAFS